MQSRTALGTLGGLALASALLFAVLSIFDTAPVHAGMRLAQASTPTHFGPLLRFARSAPRPPSPAQPAAHAFTLRPIDLRTADDRRIRAEGIVAHLRIDDPARFERAFAHVSDKMKNATDRIQVGFEDELRRATGRLTLPQIAAFDPFVLLDAGTRLRRLLDQVGLAIDDLDGETMGYRSRIP